MTCVPSEAFAQSDQSSLHVLGVGKDPTFLKQTAEDTDAQANLV